MYLLKRAFWFAILLLPLASCSNSVKRSYFPGEVIGEHIAFYTVNSELPSNQYLIAKDFLYVFNRDGSYRGTLDGDLHELGTHDYTLKDNSNQADLVMHFTDHHESYSYNIQMTYESAYAGTWEITYTNGPNHGLKEMGTFRFIK